MVEGTYNVLSLLQVFTLLQVLTLLQVHKQLQICIFMGVKSTAHPPIIGALGHSTDFIAKQPNTATIKIDYSFMFFSSCEDF